MADHHIVIIGNGIASDKAVEFLRDRDKNSRITIISDEFTLLYHRHLLPRFIIGEIQESDLFLRPLEYYKERNIRLRLGQRVIKIDFSSKILFLQHMEKIHYSHLLLCLGGKPSIPEIHYAYRNHFSTLKSLQDAKRLKSLLPTLKRILIIGGDLISVRVASIFLKAGLKVVFLINRNSFWPLDATEELLDEFQQSMKSQGAEVWIDDVLIGIESGFDNKHLVTTQIHQNQSFDLVGGFFGLTPDVDFLLRSGLDLDRGILVNEFLETSIPGVFAAGDCAQIYNPSLRNYWISIGWANASQLGQTAAHNILGSMQAVNIPNKNVINFDGIQVQSAWWMNP